MKGKVRKIFFERNLKPIKGERVDLIDVTYTNQLHGRYMKMFLIRNKSGKEIGQIVLLEDNEIWCKTYLEKCLYEKEAIELIIAAFNKYAESFIFNISKWDKERIRMLKEIGFKQYKVLEKTIVFVYENVNE